MHIIQEPITDGIHFHSTIPDIIIEKNDASNGLTFELVYDGQVVLKEAYSYDSQNRIRIQNIGDIAAGFFKDDIAHSIPTNYSVKWAIYSDFLPSITYRLTEGATIIEKSFHVFRCDAQISVDASTWMSTNFLTRSFRTKRTTVNTNEYLSFFAQNTSLVNIRFNYKLFYLNNGVVIDAVGVCCDDIVSASPALMTVNTSLRRILGIAGLPAETIVYSYDVWVTGSQAESNKYTYLVDRTPLRNQTYLVFINSFGVPETFTSTGQTINKKTNEVTLANIQTYYRKTQNKFISQKQCFSGYLSEREMEWIDDLLMSYAVGLYTYHSGFSDEVTLVNIEKSDSMNNELHAFSFEYRRANNRHFVFSSAPNGVFDETFDQTFD